MRPGKYDITIYCGATYIETLAWYRDAERTEQIDFNEYTGRAEIRNTAGDLLLVLDNAEGRFNPQVDKRAQLFIADEHTRSLPVGTHRYDLLVRETVSGIVTPLLTGHVHARALVTQTEP